MSDSLVCSRIARNPVPGVPVRKFFVLSLLALIVAGVPVLQAHAQTPAQSRAYKKAARKAQKDMVKYSKQQQKAMKKSAKAQRKELKRAQRQRTSY